MTRQTSSPGSDIDWMSIVVGILIFGFPAGTFIGSIFASITHIKDWAGRHLVEGAGNWQAWQFAIVIELIPIFGLLVMWKLRRQGRESNVPRWIFGLGLTLSMLFQIGYVGNLVEVSKIAVAIGPTLLALGATEVLLWLGRKATVKAKTLEPANVPPPPMDIPASPLANVPPAGVDTPADVPLDTNLQDEHLSPWTSPPGTPLPDRPVPQDTTAEISALSTPGHEDKPQATAVVPPPASPSAGGVDMGGQDLPDTQDTAALSPTLSGGHDPQDMPEGDTVQGEDTSAREGGTSGLDPVDLEMWELSQKGMTKPQLAAKYKVSDKTIQRRLGKVRKVIETTELSEEHADA